MPSGRPLPPGRDVDDELRATERGPRLTGGVRRPRRQGNRGLGRGVRGRRRDRSGQVPGDRCNADRQQGQRPRRLEADRHAGRGRDRRARRQRRGQRGHRARTSSAEAAETTCSGAARARTFCAAARARTAARTRKATRQTAAEASSPPNSRCSPPSPRVGISTICVEIPTLGAWRPALRRARRRPSPPRRPSRSSRSRPCRTAGGSSRGS